MSQSTIARPEGRTEPRPAGRRPSRRRRFSGSDHTRLVLGTGRTPKIVAFGALTVMALVWLLPFAWALNTSFKTETDASALPLTWIPPSGFTLDAYRSVWQAGNIQMWALNSLLVSVAVTVITVGVSALAAYGFSRTTFRGRNVLFALTLGSIMVPSQILIVPLFDQMGSWNLADTYAAIILPQVVMPVMVFILKKFFDGIPRELEEAARIDGAPNWRIFVSVVLPLSRPILAAVAIFVFINAWNNFLWPFIIASDPALMTLPVGLPNVLSAYGVQYSQEMAAAMLAAFPLIVVFMLFQRHIVQSIATTGLGGQ